VLHSSAQSMLCQESVRCNLGQVCTPWLFGLVHNQSKFKKV